MKHCHTILTAAITLGYLLGCYKGYVALWKDGKSEPAQIFPCIVDTLPEADQTALLEGIRARSELELNMILEDYLS